MIPYSDLLTASVPAADHVYSYGSDPLQFGELRMPSGSAKVPLVVFIHGGCWQAQYDIRHSAGAARALADDGFAVWSVEYRRVGNNSGGWPGTFDDIAHAVDYVRTLATDNPRLDTSRVVLMGHSAGGQLALWAASRRQGEMNGLFISSTRPLAIAGVVSLAGITDLAAYGAQAGGCNSAVTPLMGGTAQEEPARYRAVNPIERPVLDVPVHLVHGESDPIVPLSQSRDFAARTPSSVLVVVPGAGHFDMIAPQSTAWPFVLQAAHAIADGPAVPRVHTGNE